MAPVFVPSRRMSHISGSGLQRPGITSHWGRLFPVLDSPYRLKKDPVSLHFNIHCHTLSCNGCFFIITIHKTAVTHNSAHFVGFFPAFLTLRSALLYHSCGAFLVRAVATDLFEDAPRSSFRPTYPDALYEAAGRRTPTGSPMPPTLAPRTSDPAAYRQYYPDCRM